MGIVNGLSIVNNLIAGSMTGAQLQTYLATGANLASFVQVTNVRRQLQVLRNTPAAVTAVTASATASATIVANDTALRQWLLYGTSYNWRSFANLAAVLASAPAMAEVAASGAAMAVLAASQTAMAAVAASSTAMAAVAASSTAMTTILASSEATTTVIASPIAMPAVAASATAMALVAASSMAMAAVAASANAKMAIYNADVALAAIAASAPAVTALRAAGAQYAVFGPFGASGSAVTITGPNAAGKYILLGVSKNNVDIAQTVTVTTRRSGSSVANSGLLTSGASSTAATSYPLAVPVATPFTFTSSNAIAYSWYFGMLRCDV